MFDGDPATVWEPLGQPEGYQHWVIVDLQTSFKIHRVTIANNGDGVHDVVSFSMESSITSSYVWEAAYSSAEVLSGIPMPQYFTPEFVGRYLRFKVNTQSGVRPSVREVALYGKENTGDPESLPCPHLNTGCITSDMAGKTAPPGEQDCYVTASIHEGLRSAADPLQVHRSGNVHLHGDLLVNCGEDHELKVYWTVREHNQTSPEKVMDELLPRGTTTNNVHLSIPPKTLPLGVHMIQFQVVMNVTRRGHISVSVVQTWVEFIRVPVVYSLGSTVRTVLTDEVTSRLGCWADRASYAISGLEGLDPILDGEYRLRTDAISKCKEAAVSRGYEVFALQNGGWCGSSASAKQTYQMYGESTACQADGEGGPRANEVYLVTRSIKVRGDLSYDPEGLLPTAGFTYNWSCRVTQLSAATTCASVRGKYMQDPSWIMSSSGTPWVVNGVSYDAGKLFDGNPETFWNPLYTPRHSTDRNIVLDFRLPCTVSKVAWNNYGDVVHDMSAFKLQKSQVGSPYTWEDVVSVTNIPVGTNQRRVFGGFQGKARYWRFVITHSPYGWQPYLRELQLRVSPDPSTMDPIDIPEGFNVAEGRSASTNYLINSKAPEKAVDGNTNPHMGQGSCMRTILDQPDPWLKIDLCHQFSINRVVLYNRMDRDPERINPFNLHLGNAPEVVNNPTWGGDLNFDPAQFVTKTIPVGGVRARYVGIRLPGPSRTLQLCEVQVFVNDRYISTQESCVLLGCWRVDSSHPGMLVFDSPLDYGLHDLIPAVPRPAGLVADVSVDITAGDLPPVTLHTAIHLTPDYTLSGLDLHCEENCDPWKTVSTQPLSLYTDSEIFGTTEFSLVEFPVEFPGQQWTSGIDNVTSDRLRVLGGTFWAEGYYTIRLTDHHTADCGDLSRVAEWRFHVYPPPAPPVVPGDDGMSTGPVCTLQPADGVSLIDQFCVACPGFLDILGPVEVSIRFQLTPAGELATATFPGDGPAGDNRIFISASSRLWVGYTPLFDLAVGTIQLFVRADSVDGRFFEFNLAPIEIRPPTVSQLQSYLDAFFAHPGGVFFRQLALGDSESGYKGAILASAAAGGLAYTGYDVLEIVDMITEALSMVDLEDVESINGVALSTFLTTVVPHMVSGKSQVLAAASLRAAFESTRELAGNTTDGVTSVEVVNKLAAFMFSGTVNVLSASSVLAGKEHLVGKSFSADLAYCQEATTIAFQALDILDDIYLNKLMPEFSDPEIFADHSMSKFHIRIKRENRTRLAERVYHVRGDSDSLVRVSSFPDLLGDSCINSTVGIQFLESNFNPYEYSNNSHEIGADVTGLGVKCGNRTIPVSGLSDPIDILTRRSKNDSISELIYVFKASEPLGNMAIFQFFVRKNRSALSLELDFNNTLFPPDVTMFLRKEAPPTAAEYDWTATLPVPDEQMVYIPWTNGTNLTSNPYHWLLSPEEVNITSEDVENMTNYFVGVQLGSEQDLGSGDVVNFTLYVFETSCVYFDEELHLWQTDGCEVGLMSNTSHIHCRCYHLTKFSGFVAPNPLNIAEALSANVLENPSGLVLVLTVFGAYLMGIVWARKSDRRDVVKAGIGILPGHKLNPRQDCQYLITVYTGFKGNSGTTAEVTIVLCSQDHESPPFTLSDQKRILFERGSVDSFLVSTSQPLGALRYIRVWHSNGGYSPGWFLSQIVVTNRGDNTPNYFICNRWFALDRDDGNITRVLIEADPNEMKKFRNLFLAKSSRDMNDGHLWFSVAGRPARSPFSRVQRLSCCLTLLYSTMVTNIMFFGRGDDFDPPEPIRIGGIEIDPPISLPQKQNDKEASKKRNEPPSLWHRKEKDTVQKRQSHDYAEKYLCKRPIQLSFVESMADIDAGNETNPEDVETEQKSSLPWWSVYIGWLLVWSASFPAAFFTVLYSLSFGRAKAEAWLFTFLTSFLTDLFLIQPFKLMLVAVLFALLAKKPVEDEDPVPAPLHQDEEYLEENTHSQVVRNGTRLWRTATGWARYLWTEESKTTDQLNERDPELAHSNSPPDEADLAKQRAVSLERSKRRKQVLEVLLFGLFVTVIMMTSYGERSPLAFYVTKNVQRLLFESGDIGFSETKDIPSFWTWVTTGLIPATHAAQWYNGRHSEEAAILEDMLTHPLGPVQLRQVRLTPGKHCEPPKQIASLMPRCTVAYSIDVSDTRNYTESWNKTSNTTGDLFCISTPIVNNATTSPWNCLEASNPWSYTFASVTDGFPYFGKQGTYLSGGYVTSLGSTQQRSLARTAYLQQHAWLDDKTRAVFIELTLYNPHVNLFSLVSMATEFTGLGTVYKGSEVVTLRLIQHDTILLLVLRGCLAIFILFFVIREGKALFARPLEYLSEFWSWVEILIIAVGFSALGVYFHTQSIIDDVAIQRAAGNASFGAYKSAVGWFQVYTNLLGLLICCVTLKFVRILRFNSHVYALSMTMRRSLKPVTQFMFTAGILIMAFTQMANLIFGVKLAGYKNITSSLQSLLFMMLGSFDFEALEQGHTLLGPLVFFTYQCMMQFFLLSMFMAIIMDVYAEETQSTNTDELNFNAFVKESAIRTMKKVQNRKSYNVDVKKNISIKDKGTLADMLVKIDRMVDQLDNGFYD